MYNKILFRFVGFSRSFYMEVIPVAERSKARVYGRLIAGIAGLNPAGRMDV